jgi:hypothetical protein
MKKGRKQLVFEKKVESSTKSKHRPESIRILCHDCGEYETRNQLTISRFFSYVLPHTCERCPREAVRVRT